MAIKISGTSVIDDSRNLINVVGADVSGIVTTTSTVVGSTVTINSGGINNTGVTTVSSGSVSAPSITPSGDSNTGVFFPAADTIALAEGGVEALRVNSDGKLLVGTQSSSGSFLLEVNGSIRDSSGSLRSAVQNSKTSAYTLIASDSGKHVSTTSGGVTVPENVFSAGDIVAIYNNSNTNITITQGSNVTLRQAGTANTGNRTLAQYGVATVMCVGSNTFVISGSGLS